MMSKQSKPEPLNKKEAALASESAKLDTSLTDSSKDKFQNEASIDLSSPSANKPFIDPHGDSTFIDKAGGKLHLECQATVKDDRDAAESQIEDQNNQMSKSEMQNRRITIPLEQILRDKDGNVTRTIIPADL